jgi:flagellar biosynthesis anti-sigma factor FlgM
MGRYWIQGRVQPAGQLMKVNDPSLSSLGAAGTARALQTGRPEVPARGNTNTGSAPSGSSDDVHLSELVRSLRSLASDSPERQAKIEQLTRAYASGTYTVDAQATAGAILNDAVKG